MSYNFSKSNFQGLLGDMGNCSQGNCEGKKWVVHTMWSTSTYLKMDQNINSCPWVIFICFFITPIYKFKPHSKTLAVKCIFIAMQIKSQKTEAAHFIT